MIICCYKCLCIFFVLIDQTLFTIFYRFITMGFIILFRPHLFLLQFDLSSVDIMFLLQMNPDEMSSFGGSLRTYIVFLELLARKYCQLSLWCSVSVRIGEIVGQVRIPCVEFAGE